MSFGSKTVQAVSVLMIMFGAVSALVELVNVVTAAADKVLLLTAYILLFSGGIAEMAAGVIGFINCKIVSKAKLLLICGIALAAVICTGYILAITAGGYYSIFGLLSGLLLPIMFTAGAALMKKGT